MVATSFEREREFDDGQFTAKTIFQTDHSKAVLAFFREGQFVPVHAPQSDVTVSVRRGRGIVRDGDRTHEVGPGDVVAVEAGRKRGVRADEGPLEATLVTAPPPTEADHDLVREGLRTGTFDPTDDGG